MTIQTDTGVNSNDGENAILIRQCFVEHVLADIFGQDHVELECRFPQLRHDVSRFAAFMVGSAGSGQAMPCHLAIMRP